MTLLLFSAWRGRHGLEQDPATAPAQRSYPELLLTKVKKRGLGGGGESYLQDQQPWATCTAQLLHHFNEPKCSSPVDQSVLARKLCLGICRLWVNEYKFLIEEHAIRAEMSLSSSRDCLGIGTRMRA